jgi:hypothetical protein
MFCPKCATQNSEGASFCRSCGANISLVPQAMTGQVTEAHEPESREAFREGRRRNRHSGPPTISEAITKAFMGIGFLVVAFAIALFGRDMGGNTWWFWMLIPAFLFLGKGIGEFIQAKQQAKSLPSPPASLISGMPAQNLSALPPRNTAQLRHSPPSVTEGTTRHLGAEAPTRYLDQDQEEH